MTETAAGSLSIRACRLEDIQSVLELWRQAEATPGVTDTADDLRRAVADSPACVLVAEVEGTLTRQGARRITALVEKEHPWAMNFWEAVGYRVDERIVRRVRNP